MKKFMFYNQKFVCVYLSHAKIWFFFYFWYNTALALSQRILKLWIKEGDMSNMNFHN